MDGGRRVNRSTDVVRATVEVELVGEHATWFEIGLGVALQALDGALGLRIGGLAELPGDLQLPAERRERLRRAAAVAVDAGLAIPDQRRRQRAQALQAAGDPGQQILGLRREHEHARTGARVAQTRNDNPAATRLAMTDRNLRARSPDIELADLARPIDRALKRPARRGEQRPDLP